MQATWRIEMLGGMRTVSEDATISQFRTRNVELLLAMLAIKPGQSLAREVLGERLWPGEETSVQRERLRYVKSRLGAALGGDPFEKSGNSRLAFRPDAVGSDVAEFDAALLAAEARTAPGERLGPLRTAADLYRGELLPGFYDDWSCAERERLREARFDVLSGLVRDLETTGRLDEAVPWRRTLAAEFPERSLAARPTAVASPGAVVIEGSFFGRDAEREAVAAWFDRGAERVLTLVGPGGMGKTRLAREATADTNAVFVSLAELTDAGRFFEALHGALGLPQQGADLRAQSLAHLRASARPFLILDNLEQIADKIGPVLRDLLRSVSGLRLLATSRKRLNLAEERVFALNPLPGGPSVALFLDRAQRLRPDFAQTPESRALVGEICALLEGLPLAIELAAARTVILGPAQIKAQLARRLGFLVNRRHAPVERHRSLRAALDWSIELLSPEQQRVFARLSVFRGGFTLEQAEAVAADPAISTLNALDDLHAHSLLSVRFDESGEARYDLLVVIREYAEELLRDSGESQTTEERHARLFANLTEEARARPEPGALRACLEPEWDNIREAIRFARESGDSEALFLWLDRLGGTFFELGFWRDMKLLLDALEGIDLEPIRRMRYVSLQGALARRQGREEEAARWWQEWGRRADEDGSFVDRRASYTQLCLQWIELGEFQKADACFREKRELFAEDGDRYFSALMAWKCYGTGEKQSAMSHCQAYLNSLEPTSTIQTTWHLYCARILIDVGALTQFLPVFLEAFRVVLDEGHAFLAAEYLLTLSTYFEKNGSPDDAYLARKIGVSLHAIMGYRQWAGAKREWDASVAESGRDDALFSGNFDWKTMSETLYRKLQNTPN